MNDLATNRFETSGIVIHEQAYQESSKILRIFTRDRGKLSVLARGALRAKSQILALTQPMVEASYLFSQGRSFAYFHEGQLIHDHQVLKQDFRTMLAGTFLLEVVDKVVEGDQVNVKLYDLLAKTLLFLEVGFSKTLLNAFLIKTLTFLGYRPILHKKTKITDNTRYFDPKSGIIEYGLKVWDGKSIEEADLDYLEAILYARLDNLPTLKDNEDFIFELLMKLLYVHLDLDKINTYNLLVTF